jgi:hypothetical protein
MYPMEPDQKIAPELLIDRQLYILNSRNLLVGTWNIKLAAFIDIEYEWDSSGGTAHALSLIDKAIIPSHILMAIYTHLECKNNIPVSCESDKTQSFIHLTDKKTCQHGEVMLVMNQALFDYIKPYNDAQKPDYTDFFNSEKW